jgi:hypothetical protein
MSDEPQQKPPRILPPNFLEICERRARKAVCATAWNDKTGREEIVGFRFHPLIADWPICKQAEAEGWAKDLRGALIHSVRQQMFLGQEIDVAKALPPDWWLKQRRKDAKRYRLAAEWQEKNLDSTFDARKFVGRLMASGDDLTERSKAMLGEAAE